VHVGLRTLGGDPGAFYALDVERQVDVLAILRVEREAQPGKRGRGGSSIVDQVQFKDEGARAYWAHAFR
jgi:hypothetical protein